MIMKRITLLLGLALLVSCGDKIIETPDNLIPKEKMTQMLYDLAVINAAKSTGSVTLESYFDSPTTFLFEKYGVDSLQFVRSDVYYASQPLVYESIYKEVAAKLEKDKQMAEEARKKKNDSLSSRPKKIKDSLAQ